MAVPTKEMQIVAQRIATFQHPHQLTKRRASSQGKKKGANTIEWPHRKPDPEALAKAGFFFRPALDSADNVQCFLCTVKLDGWEPEDDPIQEHLAHSNGCAWATSLSVWREDDDPRGPEMRDPLSEEMVAARTDTFTINDGWPHEGKKGWKCKISKLVDAGWAWDPAAEGEDGDGATCFYCNLSLDGWEPKDDPFLEHKRRVPDCRFFELLKLYHGPEAAAGTTKKAKGKGTTSARASTTSKASRLSAQSAMSEAPSMPGSFVDTLRDSRLAGADDSVLTTVTIASTATTTGGKAKKGGRKKAATTGNKSKKKTNSDSNAEEASLVLHAEAETQQTYELEFDEELAPAPNATRKVARNSKQVDSSIVEISQLEAAATKKATRGRKAKAKPDIVSSSAVAPQTPDAAVIAEKRLSEASHQLQEELDLSADNFAPMDESTPAAEPPKRGIKRTSEGLWKEPDSQSAQELKRPRGRPKNVSGVSATADSIVEEALVTQDVSTELVTNGSGLSTKPAAKKGKGRPKGKTASHTRPSNSSKATVTIESVKLASDAPADLARDEMEIEQELERIASEQAVQEGITSDQDQVDQYETSPSHGRVSKDSAELQKLQEEVHAEEREPTINERDTWPQDTAVSNVVAAPSPSESDKENQPSSVIRSTVDKAQPHILISPTKTTRIPLAADTPNRSPGKNMVSPSKQVSHLTSTTPWSAIDLDSVLLASPQPTPGKLGEQLASAGGALTSAEKQMTVEQWVRYRAEKSEEELRRRCEGMVASFEREGMRGLEYLTFPSDLPRPEDDGACSHLTGSTFPSISLPSTAGDTVDPSTLSGLTIIFCYPRTGAPNEIIPDSWNAIPGARGCTPQACSFRDSSDKLLSLGVSHLFGASTQPTPYQQEVRERVHLPYQLLSDEQLAMTEGLRLPTFDWEGQKLIRRLTLAIEDGKIVKVWYPVFPPDQSANEVLKWLEGEYRK